MTVFGTVQKKSGAAPLALTENGLKFFVPMDLTNNYENTYIW